TASSASALEVRGLLRSIGRNKLFFSSPRQPLAAPAPSLPLPAGGLPGGGSSYGSRGRPPDTTGRAVPLTGFPRGVLGGRLQATHCGSAQACSRTNVHKDHGPWTMDQQRLQAQLYSHLPRATAI
ncbi:hypothetical protein THAOC_05730, partial [Thalassiosira oceanica]